MSLWKRGRGGWGGEGRLVNYKFPFIPVKLQELNSDQLKLTCGPNPNHFGILLNVDRGLFNYQYRWFQGLLNYSVK
jgi:hypothetical protein